jgi:microsomal dipeptidase-like Zn-dependent dipeptidase
VTKSPAGQNFNSNPADTDTITGLVKVQLQPPRTWGSLLQRSLYHAEKLHGFAEASQGRLRVITTPADIDRLLADRQEGETVVGGMLSIEGLHDLEGNIENLDVLYAAGFRIAGLTHFFDNDVAGSMHGLKKGGLTPLGWQVVPRMEALGMIVDLAHSSHATIADVLALAKRPVISSHGGVLGTCKINRNLSDDEIRGIAKTGGLIGIGYFKGAICSTDPADVARAIAHVRDVAGVDYVGLGSDFDGGTTVSFDASQVAVVTQALLDRASRNKTSAKSWAATCCAYSAPASHRLDQAIDADMPASADMSRTYQTPIFRATGYRRVRNSGSWRTDRGLSLRCRDAARNAEKLSLGRRSTIQGCAPHQTKITTD